MSGRAAARLASARIHASLNADVKTEPDDEHSPQDPAYELENGGDVGRVELNKDTSVDLNAYRTPAKKPRKASMKMVECRSCGKTKRHAARGLCQACYQRKYPTDRKVIECRSCGKTKKHQAHGLCMTCYQRQHSNDNKIKCKSCGETKPHYARGLCRACYHLQYSERNAECGACGETNPHRARGLCPACYCRNNKIKCRSCGEIKPHNAHGLCSTCYCRDNKIECRACGETKPHRAHGLCSACYKRERCQNKVVKTRRRLKADSSSNFAKASTSTKSPNPVEDTITLSSASEDETDAVVSSGEEGENYGVKPIVKKEEPVLSSGDEANLKREVDSSSSDDEEDGYSDAAIKSEIKQEP